MTKHVCLAVTVCICVREIPSSILDSYNGYANTFTIFISLSIIIPKYYLIGGTNSTFQIAQ
jgi:hypothetical protein